MFLYQLPKRAFIHNQSLVKKKFLYCVLKFKSSQDTPELVQECCARNNNKLKKDLLEKYTTMRKIKKKTR